jgi:hypothetical protein
VSEIATQAQVSRYKAEQTIAVAKTAPDLLEQAERCGE